MKTFSWSKALGYGVMMWGVATIVLWGLSLTDLNVGWTHGIVAAVIAIAAYLFASDAAPEDAGQALGYGFIWVAVGMIMDAVITRIFDTHIFTAWQYYIGYVLVLLAPLLRLEQPKDRSIPT